MCIQLLSEGLPSRCGLCFQFVLLPPNRVSDGNHGVTSRRKECCLAVMPQEIGPGFQGILLEDKNGIRASHRAIGTWME